MRTYGGCSGSSYPLIAIGGLVPWVVLITSTMPGSQIQPLLCWPCVLGPQPVHLLLVRPVLGHLPSPGLYGPTSTASRTCPRRWSRRHGAPPRSASASSPSSLTSAALVVATHDSPVYRPGERPAFPDRSFIPLSTVAHGVAVGRGRCRLSGVTAGCGHASSDERASLNHYLICLSVCLFFSF